MFQEGREKTGGRQKGTPNKLTRTVRETVLSAFNELQDDPKANIVAWAKRNPRDFYQIAAKLIPQEITGRDGERLELIKVEVINGRTEDQSEPNL